MNNDIFPSDVRDAANKMGGDWWKGADFDGEGQVVQVTKPMEKVQSNNPTYGAAEGDFLVEQEILEVGQTLRFTLKGTDGVEKQFDTKSAPFFIGFKNCAELGVGDYVHIKREGKTDKTRYTMTKVDAPEAQSEHAEEPAF